MVYKFNIYLLNILANNEENCLPGIFNPLYHCFTFQLTRRRLEDHAMSRVMLSIVWRQKTQKLTNVIFIVQNKPPHPLKNKLHL